MTNRSTSLSAAITAAMTFAMAFLILGLQVDAIVRQSLTGDAAYHLFAGHQALRYGENRLNLEHPPLVKMIAALPLLAEKPLARPTTVEGVVEASHVVFDVPDRLHRIQRASRTLILFCFGLPFLACCYFLGKTLGNRRTGLVLAGIMGLAIPSLPNLSILQTDTAVSLGFALTLLGALRFLAQPGSRNAVIMGFGLGLALATKFSGVLLLPTVMLAILLARNVTLWLRLRSLLYCGTLAVVLVGSSYAVANWSYDSEAGRDTIRRYCRGEALIVDTRLREWEEPLLAVEGFSPGLAQWLTGFLGIRAQNAIGVYPTYAFGALSSRGRWWYFPAVLLIKTPILILIATLAGTLLFWRRPGSPFERSHTLLAATAAIYLLVAVTSSYNLGVRHLLPILPLLYLPAAKWIAASDRRTILVGSLLALEAVFLSPLWMSATNTWWLGSSNPTRFSLSGGNTEYHQSFLALAKASENRGIEKLHVVYPLLSPRELRAYLPNAEVAEPGQILEPGSWVAVNILVEQYLPATARALPESLRGSRELRELAATWRPLWKAVAAGEDHGIVAGTFHLYRLPLSRTE